MITPLQFVPARREEMPDYVRAAYLQGQGELEVQKLKDQQRRERNELPGELYGTYSEITGTNPIADALSRNRGRGTAEQGATPTGTPPQAASNITPMMPNAAGGASQAFGATTAAGPAPVSAALPAATHGMATKAGTQAAGNAAGSAGAAAMPFVGGAISAGLTAQQGGSQRDQVKSGVGSAATGALATYAAPLAASGPVGWAGIAALAAASLYGMLG